MFTFPDKKYTPSKPNYADPGAFYYGFDYVHPAPLPPPQDEYQPILYPNYQDYALPNYAGINDPVYNNYPNFYPPAPYYGMNYPAVNYPKPGYVIPNYKNMPRGRIENVLKGPDNIKASWHKGNNAKSVNQGLVFNYPVPVAGYQDNFQYQYVDPNRMRYVLEPVLQPRYFAGEESEEDEGLPSQEEMYYDEEARQRTDYSDELEKEEYNEELNYLESRLNDEDTDYQEVLNNKLKYMM